MKLFGIAVLCGIVGWWVWFAQSMAQDDPFKVPVLRYGDYGEWDPDRELTFRYDHRRGETVSGRYVVFSFPIGHTIVRSPGAPDVGSTGFTRFQHKALFRADGTVEILPQATARDEWGSGGAYPPFYTSSLSLGGSRGETIRLVMEASKQLDRPFPGYEVARFWTHDEEDFHYVGEHCGFDMFESIAYRRWHLVPEPFDLTRAPPPDMTPPFDRARVFGWPDTDGTGYDFGVICEDNGSCRAAFAARPWLPVTLHFRREWFCEIPKVVPAHLDWLESRIVEEETEILNPDWE